MFFLLLAVYFGVAGWIWLNTEKGVPELYINAHWSPPADIFFKYFTYVGDGWVYTVFVFSLLLLRFRHILVATLAILLKTAVVQYFKLSLFHNSPRPTKYFPYDTNFHFVDGVQVYATNSFPSGHTSTAFCLAVVVIYILAFENVKYRAFWQVVCFTMAFLVGISRMYLLQHFLEDTYVGTFIGAFFAWITVIALYHILPKYPSTAWNRSLLRLKG